MWQTKSSKDYGSGRGNVRLVPKPVWQLPSTAEWLVSASSSKQLCHSRSVRLESKSTSQRVWKLVAHDVGLTSFFTNLLSRSSSLESTTRSLFTSSSVNFHSTTSTRTSTPSDILDVVWTLDNSALHHTDYQVKFVHISGQPKTFYLRQDRQWQRNLPKSPPPPPELQQLALNFLATFLVVTLQNNNRHTSARAQKIFPIRNMRPLSIREPLPPSFHRLWFHSK